MIVACSFQSKKQKGETWRKITLETAKTGLELVLETLQDLELILIWYQVEQATPLRCHL